MPTYNLSFTQNYYLLGTDRNNLLQMKELSKNMPYSLKDATFWENVESLTDPEASSEDIAVGFATSGFYCGKLTLTIILSILRQCIICFLQRFICLHIYSGKV